MVKTCGFCENTDGMCYTSNPPKRKCTVTGKFHEYDHICDAPKTNADRIRSMTDEEMADIMSMHTATGACNDWGIPHEKCGGNCRECIIEWLKQPVEVPKGD